MKKLKYSTLLISSQILSSQLAFATPAKYEQIRDQINHFENSIIQEFSIDFPKNKENISASAYAKLASQVEVKFGIQKTLFYKLESELFKIESSLKSIETNGDLSREEVESLKTSIEYANRIILKSRKAEINQIYAEFMASLTHSPKLTDIYSKLKKMDIKDCSLSNIIIDEGMGTLSFKVEKTNQFGGLISSNFQITHNDIDAGQLTSRLDSHNKSNPFHNIITQYWTNDENDQNLQRFTLLQDENGSIKEASFKQENEEPLISFLGFSIGTQKIEKNFDCGAQEKFAGPKPASSKD